MTAALAEVPNLSGRALAAWRKRRAVELVHEGRSYDEIAGIVGYRNKGSAFHTVAKAMNAHVVQAVEGHRQREVERLNALQAGLWDAAMAGNVQAVQAVLKIIVTRCKVLGLVANGAAVKAEEQPRTVVIRS